MNLEAKEEIFNKTQAVLDSMHINAEDELIRQVVLKCIEICDNLQFSPEGPSTQAKYQRTLCAHAIQKHFGL